MSVTVKSLGIDRLNREERSALVQKIWDSIAAEQGPPLLSEEQRQALERRVAEDDHTPDEVIPWEQVKASILSRLQQP
ncbi:MAG: addiction module protein [Gemmataceae bacterium]